MSGGNPVNPVPPRALPRLAGARVLVLDARDPAHPGAGYAETHIHEIARRWVAAGAAVTVLTARPAGQPDRATIDGVDVHRAGGTFSVHLRTAARLLRTAHRFDVVVDCRNGIPFFTSLFTGTPIVHVAHQVHQNRFATRFGSAVAAVGRWLGGPPARWGHRTPRGVAVSASAREEMRRRLRLPGIIDVVPSGVTPPSGDSSTRAGVPTVVAVSRLVPHKGVDVLLRAVAAARSEVPGLRVEIVGDGPELDALRSEARALDLAGTVTFHGRLPAEQRDALVRSAWLTTSTSAAEGWGQAVLDAAAMGVPCVALGVAGIRDAVIDGRTGWLVDAPGGFAAAMVGALSVLSGPADAERFAAECRAWAGCFGWDRSAELLAASVVAQMPQPGPAHRGRTRRDSRSDTTTLARFQHPDPETVARAVRLTDEIAVDGTTVSLILRGCDDVDAVALLEGMGATELQVRPASRHELLGGPAAVGRFSDRPGVRIPVQRTEPRNGGALGSVERITAQRDAGLRGP